MKTLVHLSLNLGILGALAGCPSSESSAPGPEVCEKQSACSADEANTQKDIDACKTSVCKNELYPYIQCVLDTQVCGADNKTDETKLAESCANERKAYETCYTASIADGG